MKTWSDVKRETIRRGELKKIAENIYIDCDAQDVIEILTQYLLTLSEEQLKEVREQYE